MYGVSAKGVSESIGITVKQAEKIIEDFYQSHKKIAKWMDEQVNYCRKNGFVEMLGGRKRRLPKINSSDKFERLRNERQTTNAIIQGSAAIQTKLTMIAIHNWCKENKFDLLFSIHDEVAVLVPETISLEKIKEFEKLMLDTVKLSVPNKTDLEISTRWGEGMKVQPFIEKRGY
jgi:DNA polymerase-1